LTFQLFAADALLALDLPEIGLRDRNTNDDRPNRSITDLKGCFLANVDLSRRYLRQNPGVVSDLA
jgi:hypothetical protein